MRDFTSEAEIGWAAGFFDGEGCVHYAQPEQRTPRIIVSLAQVRRSPLDRFRAVAGTGNVNGPYSPRSTRSQPYFNWAAEGLPTAQRLFSLLGPWLDEQKTEAFESAITSFQNWLIDPQCGKGHGPLKRNKRDHWYCPQCRVLSGRKAAKVRWSCA